MSAPTTTYNKKQRELIKLHELSPTFNLEEALAEFASKPRGRPAKPKVESEVEETVESIYREGRIVLEHLESYVPLVRKSCAGCGMEFLVNYRSCSFCSDVCRAATLREKYGIIWNPDNTEANRWQYWKVPPSTVKPETLRRLEAFARHILGIEPTQEDLALAQEADANRLAANSASEASGVRETRVESGSVASGSVAESKPVATNSGAFSNPPAPISTDRLMVVSEIKKRYAAGEITAHELQVQLAAALRG